MDSGALKKIACDAIDSWSGKLAELSLKIWQQPELSLEEHFAHSALTTFLKQADFTEVQERAVLDTAFVASWGQKNEPTDPHIAILCEYDALPGIGHACGHNLIAELGVAAGIGIKSALQSLGSDIGKVSVIGCPAEETGVGKIRLLKGHIFDDVDCALMAHPTFEGFTHVHLPGFYSAIASCTIEFTGKAAHATACPWNGINALDAAVSTYNGISLLRARLQTSSRINCVINSIDQSPNVIPEEAQVKIMARARTERDVKLIVKDAFSIVEGITKSTGCQHEKCVTALCPEVLSNPTLANLYHSNAVNLGVVFDQPAVDGPSSAASTDMGHVSYAVPSIHPMFSIGTNEENHMAGYTTASGSQEAQPFVIQQAKALAMTAIDIFLNPHMLIKAKTELQEAKDKISMG